jgi:hypothetical protein
MEQLLKPSVRSAMAARGKRYAAAHFRWPDVMDRLLRAVLP